MEKYSMIRPFKASRNIFSFAVRKGDC
jgi:hypothetical protein